MVGRRGRGNESLGIIEADVIQCVEIEGAAGQGRTYA